MAMSRPLRLVQQAAQPIEFSCPLCESTHAAYIFGTGGLRIFRCGGCALTFSKNVARGNETSPCDGSGAVAATNRSERDHAGLLAAIDATAIKGPILLVAGHQDNLSELLRHHGLSIGIAVAEDDFGPG